MVASFGGLLRLLFHEGSDGAIEVELIAVYREVRGASITLGKALARLPTAVGLALGKIEHRLLGAAQVKRRGAVGHRLADRLNVGVGVGIEQLKEAAEVVGVALMRGRGQEQDVVGAVAKDLAQGIAGSLARGRRPGHPMGFIDDDEVPSHLLEASDDGVALGEIERGDDLTVLKPPVDAVLLADVAASEHDEFLVELFL